MAKRFCTWTPRENLFKRGISTKVYPDETFKPDNPVTRAELAKILTLAFDLQPSEFVYTEKDLSENDWYYNYLLCAGKYIPNYALPEINEKNQPYIDNRTVNAFLPQQNAMRMHVAESLVEIIKNKEQSIVNTHISQKNLILCRATQMAIFVRTTM